MKIIGENMTVLTADKYRLARAHLTLSEAERELRENMCPRTVREILAKTIGLDPADKDTLSKLLKKKIKDLNLNLRENTINRDVNNWMDDDCTFISKENSIRLSFALGLGLSKAEDLIVLLCGEQLHWREPSDIVYGVALNIGMSCADAEAFYQRFNENNLPGAEESDAEVHTKKSEIFTQLVKKDLLAISSPEELEAYLLSHWKMLGEYHNTAHATVSEFMGFLKAPYDGVDEKLSTAAIASECLYGKFIPRAAREKDKHTLKEKLILSALQKSLRMNWPNETLLNKMGTQKSDVTRKTLILLFMATDGADSAYGQSLDPPEDVYEDRQSRLENVLNECGFSPLDPRAPFDWIMLYCLCDRSREQEIDIEALKRFVEAMFADVERVPVPQDSTEGTDLQP